MPQPADYNIFVESGISFASVATLADNPVLPLTDYTDFDYDPLNAITNAFAKIEHAGQGAALQIIIEPRGERHVKHYRKILQALRKGEKRSSAFSVPESAAGEILRDFSKTLFSSKSKDEQKAKESQLGQVEQNKTYIEQVEKKIATPIVGATIRLVVSSSDERKAGQILGELEAGFNQFNNTQGNRFDFKRAESRDTKSVCEEFSFRLPAAGRAPLSNP